MIKPHESLDADPVAAAVLEPLEPRLLLSTIHVGDYFPMDVGNQWTFGPRYQTSREVVEVYWDDETKVATFDLLPLDEVDTPVHEVYGLGPQGLELRSQSKGGWGSFSFDYNPPLVLLPAEVEIGQTYDFMDLNPNADLDLYQSGVHWSGSVTGGITVVGFQTITVPAGTFRALKTVWDFRYTVSNAQYGTIQSTENSTHYWAWRLGEVKCTKSGTVRYSIIGQGNFRDSFRATRNLMSFSGLPEPKCDLTPAFGRITLPQVVVPEAGAKGNVPVVVRNDGVVPVARGQQIAIEIVARPADAGSGLEPVVLATLADRSIGGLMPGRSKTFTASVTVPQALAGGDYEIVAVVDAGGAVDESDETNNEAVASTMRSVPYVAAGYAGSAQVALTGCTGPGGQGLPDDAFTLSGRITIDRQKGETFTGSGELSAVVDGEVLVLRPYLTGVITPEGEVSGTFTHALQGRGGSAGTGGGTFTGRLVDNRLVLELSGQSADRLGGACSLAGGFRGADIEDDIPGVRTHVLCVGVHDMPSALGGDVSAWLVHEAFAQLDNIETNVLLELDTLADGGKGELIAAIESMKALVGPRDTFVFYFASHGGYEVDGDEQAVMAQYDPADLSAREETTGDEFMFLSRSGGADAAMTDDEFSSLFLDEAWQDVNKLFILDTCYAGGHIGAAGIADSGDLARLDRAAVIAAADEGDFAWAVWSPLAGCYVPVLGTAVGDALDELSVLPAVTFDDLFRVANADGAVYNGQDGRILALEDRWPVDSTIDFAAVRQATGGFDAQIGQVAVRTLRAGRKVRYTDSNGDLVTVTLTGKGNGEVVLPAGGIGDALAIRLFGTDARSALTIAVRKAGGGDGQTTVSEITVDGLLKRLSGQAVDLVGDFTSTGPVGAVVLDDVTGGHRLDLNTSGVPAGKRQTMTFTLGCVADTSIDTHGLPVSRITVTQWVDGPDADEDAGSLTAPWVGSIVARGRRANTRLGLEALPGDLAADLNLSGLAAPRGKALGSAIVAGGVVGTDASPVNWQVDGTAGPLTIRGQVDKWSAQADAVASLTAGAVGQAELTVADALGTVKAWCWSAGRIEANTIRGLNITGYKGNARAGIEAVEGDFGADVKVLGQDAPSGRALGNCTIAHDLLSSMWKIDSGGTGRLTVRGTVEDSKVVTAGSIAALTLGATVRSQYQAGVTADCDCGEVEAGQMDKTARIGSLTIAGWRLGKDEEVPDFVIDSDFLAGSFGAVVLRNSLDANAYAFFVPDKDNIRSMRHIDPRDSDRNWTWRPGWPPPDQWVGQGPINEIT